MKNTSLCYLQKDESYLMLHRIKKKNDVNFHKWIGIGGKFEEGESPEECAKREILEETGLTVQNLEYRGIVTFDCPPYETDYMHLFTSTKFSGKLIDCDEGNLEWIKKSELRNTELWEGDYIFLDLLEENAPFFSLKLSYDGDTLVSAILNGEKIK